LATNTRPRTSAVGGSPIRSIARKYSRMIARKIATSTARAMPRWCHGGLRMYDGAADDLAAPLRVIASCHVGQRERVRDVRRDRAGGGPVEHRRQARRRSDGSTTVEITVGQPSTSRPFIMIRLVGSWLALGAPRPPLPAATNGVAAQPTIR
jgi:hypothetical protein